MWRELAACQGMDVAVFFPETRAREKPARETCGQCPVRRPCLEYAVTYGCTGFWGGMSDRERSAALRLQQERS